MLKKSLLIISTCMGILALTPNAQANYAKQLENVKNSSEPITVKLQELYDLIENAYQNLDASKMTAEQIGLQLSTKAAKTAAMGRELVSNENTVSDETTQALKTLTDHTEFISCYARHNTEYKELMNALSNDDNAGIKGMLGKTVMCRKIVGIAKVTGMNNTTVTLENVAGSTPDSYEWGEAIEVGRHLIFDQGNKTPVSI